MIIVFCVLTILMQSAKPFYLKRTVVWKIQDTTLIGGMKPAVFGNPKLVRDKSVRALSFDGVDDGLIIPLNPLEGWNEFTIELLFKPDTSTSAQPRIVHIQDEAGTRCTVELRLTEKGKWYLDTFLKNGKTNKGLTLSDSADQHLCDEWYWIALSYDGTKMCHYVNGVEEGEGTVALDQMIAGQTSIGVRLNKINWFKGQVREIRFHSAALKKRSLQHL